MCIDKFQKKLHMKFTKKDNPALILIDIQKAFEDIEYWGGERNNPDAESNAAALLELWRKNDLPIFHVKHCSTTPTSPLRESHPGNEFKDIVRPNAGETIIRKNVNSAFIGTNLKELLDDAAIHTLVVVGFTTDHCVSTTVRMAGNYAFKTFLVADATATFSKIGVEGQKFSAELIHQTALASLNEEFSIVVSTSFIQQQF